MELDLVPYVGYITVVSFTTDVTYSVTHKSDLLGFAATDWREIGSILQSLLRGCNWYQWFGMCSDVINIHSPSWIMIICFDFDILSSVNISQVLPMI